jgi:serine/threonine protein kinase
MSLNSRVASEDGFVHGDLHPGNIFVTTDGKVALLAFGLVGELDDFHRRHFARYVAAWAQADGKTMARIMADLMPAGARPIPDPALFEQAVCEHACTSWMTNRDITVRTGRADADGQKTKAGDVLVSLSADATKDADAVNRGSSPCRILYGL